MQNKHDDFDGPNTANAVGSIIRALDLRSRFEARKPVFATGIVIALVAVLGGVILYSYPRESAQREVMNAPIVRADASDYRTAPSEPGGMAIPYRESTVFNTLRSSEGGQTAKVENLLPQPEQPVSRDELFAGLKVDEAAPAPVTTPDVAPGVTQDQPASTTETAQATVASVPTETILPKPAPVVAPTAPQTAAVSEDAVKANSTEPAAGVQKIDDKPAKASEGGFYVQLGSVRAREGADGEWKKLQKSFSGLSSLNLRVQEADLGAKGKFFRIQGGPVSEAQAKSICDSIKTQKPGGCLVVRQ